MDKLNTRFSIYEIGSSHTAAGYLLGELDDSEVSKKVRCNIGDLDQGTFYTILPDNLSPHDIEEWQGARMELEFVFPTHDILDSLVGRFLENPRHRVLGKNWFQKIADVDQMDISTTVTYEDELYIEISGRDLDPVIKGRGFSIRPFVLFLYQSAAPKHVRLNEKDIEEIVRELIGVVVAAFDADSYLIWWRTDRLPFLGSDLAPTIRRR